MTRWNITIHWIFVATIKVNPFCKTTKLVIILDRRFPIILTWNIKKNKLLSILGAAKTTLSPRQTCSNILHLDFSGKHSAMLQLMLKDYSHTNINLYHLYPDFCAMDWAEWIHSYQICSLFYTAAQTDSKLTYFSPASFWTLPHYQDIGRLLLVIKQSVSLSFTHIQRHNAQTLNV